ncbi:YlbE-like family protein [Bacillaceae bacterium S4-13-58]
MQYELYHTLKERPELLQYVRVHPQWYRRLWRNPEEFSLLEQEAKYYYGQTPAQRMQQWTNNIQMFSMLIQMATQLRD